jgi:hypothetical protein
VNIYKSSQILEAQSADEPVVTKKALSPVQNDTEPKKKMASHHKVRHASKQNLLKVHEQVCICLPYLTLLNLKLLFCSSKSFLHQQYVISTDVCSFHGFWITKGFLDSFCCLLVSAVKCKTVIIHGKMYRQFKNYIIIRKYYVVLNIDNNSAVLGFQTIPSMRTSWPKMLGIPVMQCDVQNAEHKV